MMNTRIVSRTLITLGILVSLATFVLGALPANWGIFLSATCFIVGGMMWPERDSNRDDSNRNAQ